MVKSKHTDKDGKTLSYLFCIMEQFKSSMIKSEYRDKDGTINFEI